MTHTDWTFRNEIQQQPIDLARAAFQMARAIAYPDLNIEAQMRRLDGLVATAVAHISPHDSILNQAEALTRYLFQDQDFQGNLPLYFDPRNSFLNDVLERKLGIPVTLSVLYLIVGQRMGLPVYGVSMPGHFIVAVSVAEQDYYFNPYHKGARLTVQDCARLVRQTSGYEFRLEFLAPAEPITILVRMLNNLRNIYVQYQQWEQAAKVIDLLTVVEPQTHRHLRDLGFVHIQNGTPHLAARYLDAYLQAVPNAPDADTIQHNVGQAIAEWVRLN